MFFFFPLRDEYKVKRFPVIVLFIIIVNCFIYFIFGFSSEYEQIVLNYGFKPAYPSLLTLLTSIFLHGSIFHLGFNMWYLWLLGDNIEDRWGRFQFLIFYLSAGIFASLLYSVMIPEKFKNIPTIGASGAISGVLGAYAVLFPKSRITFKYLIILLGIYAGEFQLYSSFWLGLWFLNQALSAFLVAKGLTHSSVAFAAHFGGFVYGMIIATGTKLYMEAKYRENVLLGKNMLYNLLGEERKILRREEEKEEIEKIKDNVLRNIYEDRAVASEIYCKGIEKYPEITLNEKVQYQIAESFERQNKFNEAEIAYKNFILNYPFSKVADNALFSLGKIYLKKGEIEKGKYAFLQIVLFYPYSDVYEEAKYYLEKEISKYKSHLSY